MNNPEEYNILIVDDSKASLDMIKSILDDKDLRIATASTGEGALKKVKANPFDLILMDILMPEMDGFQVNRALKKNKSTKGIPVIFITAKHDEESIIKGFEEGAMDYVTKPFKDAELKARIRNHLHLKRYKENLEQAKEEAEKSSKVKSEFLANMSHEIRTPISGILGVVDLLKSSSLTHQQKDYVNIIESSTDLLLTIINDILDLSKIEAGKMTLEQIPFDIRKNLEDVLALFKTKVKEKNLYMNLEVDDEVPKVLIGDPVRIKQIYMNLISNAIKFTDSGGITVRLKVKNADDSKVQLMSEVIDTGIGIDKDSRERLFKAFSQADLSTTRKHGGTGLGLAISQNLTIMMNGYIGVDSEPGKGSDFYFTLRLKKGKPEQLRKKSEDKYEQKFHDEQFRVLLVEDNKINQKVSNMLLRQLKQKVDIAENGRAALEKMKEKPFDVVFMDIHMPLMDGYEATEKIRELEQENNRIASYIVAVTANAVPEDKEKCLNIGMDDYISKPFKKETLVSLFNKLSEKGDEKNE